MSDTKRYTSVDDLFADLFKKGPWYEEAYWVVWRFCNENFSPRHVAYKIERLITWFKWGFNPKDIWSLDDSLSRWIIPRLKRLKETKQGCPMIDGFDHVYKNNDATDEEWQEVYDGWDDIMDKMILAFELVVKDDTRVLGKGEDKKIEEGLKLFARYFRNLWG